MNHRMHMNHCMHAVQMCFGMPGHVPASHVLACQIHRMHACMTHLHMTQQQHAHHASPCRFWSHMHTMDARSIATDATKDMHTYDVAQSFVHALSAGTCHPEVLPRNAQSPILAVPKFNNSSIFIPTPGIALGKGAMPNNPEFPVNPEGEFLEEFSSQFLEEANLLALLESIPEWAMLFFCSIFLDDRPNPW